MIASADIEYAQKETERKNTVEFIGIHSQTLKQILGGGTGIYLTFLFLGTQSPLNVQFLHFVPKPLHLSCRVLQK
jgi:hypothetical protein